MAAHIQICTLPLGRAQEYLRNTCISCRAFARGNVARWSSHSQLAVAGDNRNSLWSLNASHLWLADSPDVSAERVKVEAGSGASMVAIYGCFDNHRTAAHFQPATRRDQGLMSLESRQDWPRLFGDAALVRILTSCSAFQHQIAVLAESCPAHRVKGWWPVGSVCVRSPALLAVASMVRWSLSWLHSTS